MKYHLKLSYLHSAASSLLFPVSSLPPRIFHRKPPLRQHNTRRRFVLPRQIVLNPLERLLNPYIFLGTRHKMPLRRVSLLHQFRRNHALQISLAPHDINQTLRQLISDLFVVKFQLIESRRIVGAVHQNGSIGSLEVQIQNRPIGLLPRSIVVRIPIIFPIFERTVHHYRHIARILVALIEISHQ